MEIALYTAAFLPFLVIPVALLVMGIAAVVADIVAVLDR
jgi:hypothetical protein